MAFQAVFCAQSFLPSSHAGANSTEFDPDTMHPVVIEMPEHNPGDMGGTMRLGKRRTVFKTEDSILSE